MYGLIARLLLRSAGKQIASNFSRQSIVAASRRLSHASMTIGKRVGARNFRRFLFQDVISGGISWDLANDLRTRGEDTYDTTRWIMGRIIMGAAFKGVGRFALKQGGLRKMATRSATFRAVQRGRTTLRARRAASLAELQKQQRGLNRGVNLRTGELNGPVSFSDRLYNASVWSRLALRQPETTGQKLAKGVTTGFGRQFGATILFRELIDKERIAPIVWSQQLTHDLDETWLPPTDANTPYTKSELAIQIFNAGTVTRGNYGLRRVNRGDILSSMTQRNSLSYLNSLFGPQGYGQIAGAIAAREVQQALGEEDKVQSAYASRYYKRLREDSPQESNQYRIGPKRTWVSQYTRSDGTVVQGHWRTVA